MALDIYDNKHKKYDDLLELEYPEKRSLEILREIFDRDINNNILSFRGKGILLTRNEGNIPDNLRNFHHLTSTDKYEDPSLDNNEEKAKRYAIDVLQLFGHLTSTDFEEDNIKHRQYDLERSRRLHWVRTHIEENTGETAKSIVVFSAEYRNGKKRKTVFRTYIWNRKKRYVVILEPYKTNHYLLITAYYIKDIIDENGKIRKSGIETAFENRDDDIY